MMLSKTTIRIITCISLIMIINGFSSPLGAQVVINEFSASNLSQFQDNFQKYEDWIELYNVGSSSVNIGGYYLSDDSLNNMKYVIPAGTMISSNGFLRFWTSGRDIYGGGHYHTNFKLTQTKNNNEFIVFSSPSGQIIDYKELNQKTQLGHSYGRTQNGLNYWSIFKTPTPNASNNTSYPYLDYADKPDFSIYAGFYSAPVTVNITSTEPAYAIHYTLDGTLPTASSPLYTGPITISTTTVLKAITISPDPEILPSFIRYETYFINTNHTLPVVSVAGNDLTNLANGSGSLIPFGTFEYFDTAGVRKTKTYGEFNRHGQDSWALSQRSIDFVSRDEMGYNHSLEEQLFATSSRKNYQRIILRAAGDDNYPADHNYSNEGSTHMRDAYIHNMSIMNGLHLDVRRGAKSIVYMNGQYWGVYDLRDDPDNHDNTEYYYGQDKYHIQFIETWGNTWAQYGGQQALADWDNFHDFILNNNMTDPVNYNYVTDRYDVLSLIDYVTVNSFTVCSDWLNWNVGWWRGLDSTGTHLKWGFILWDNDATFGHYINYTGIPNTTPNAAPCNPEGLVGADLNDHIKILNKLKTNPVFTQLYVSRQIDLMNTVFTQNYMLSQLDSTTNLIDPEMNQQAIRWNGTYSEWQEHVQELRDFIIQRTNYLPSGFNNCYSVTGPYDLTILTDPPNSGSIKLNTLDHKTFPWTGKYYGNINTLLQATPDSGFVFHHWSSNSQTFLPSNISANAYFDLTGSDTIIAHFGIDTDIQEIRPDNPLPSVSISPNVFSQQSYINYEIFEKSPVSITIYNSLGEKIHVVVPENSVKNSGTHSEILNWSESGNPPGIYYVKFIAGDYTKTVKIIYINQ